MLPVTRVTCFDKLNGFDRLNRRLEALSLDSEYLVPEPGRWDTTQLKLTRNRRDLSASHRYK
jgi:hypothetical protein